MSKTRAIYNWIMDSNVELRVRLMYVLTVAMFIANIVSAINMIAMGQSIIVWSANILMLVLMCFTAYFVFVKRKYNLASLFISISCDFIAIPAMFFTSGGNASGMPLWMVFAVMVTCLICTGKARIILPLLAIAVNTVCMIIGHVNSQIVIPLEGENAIYNDMLFSYVTVSVILAIIIMVHVKVYDLQRKALETQQNKIAHIALFDELTGVFNRRAYEQDVKVFFEGESTERKCLAMVDVNGLKRVNDELGHAAGDEIISATARCLKEVIEPYGNVYRTGGDEFVVLMSFKNSEVDDIFKRVDLKVSEWSGKYVKSLSIAKGICIADEHPDLDYEEIEKTADSLMYKNKREYYEKSGIDRRRR